MNPWCLFPPPLDAGLPLINADGMGRAFPGIQQDTFTLNGACVHQPLHHCR